MRGEHGVLEWAVDRSEHPVDLPAAIGRTHAEKIAEA
jgi:hypothetical protein